jgi:hypothetical protein
LGPHFFGKIVPTSSACVSFWSNRITLPFIDSHSDFRSVISLPSLVGLAFLLVVFSVQLIPALKRDAREALPEDFQLPMGPTLSKGTLEEVYMFVLIYMPFIIVYSCFLVVLMSQMWAPILASTSILPSGTRYYTSWFFGAVGRRASYRSSPLSMTLLIQTSVAQRRPIERIIYHSVAVALLLLLLTWNVWIVLFLCFVNVLTGDDLLPPLLFKIVLYITMILLSISPWFFAATSGKLEGMRWWPTRDHLSRLVPSSIANATVTKCR